MPFTDSNIFTAGLNPNQLAAFYKARPNWSGDPAFPNQPTGNMTGLFNFLKFAGTAGLSSLKGFDESGGNVSSTNPMEIPNLPSLPKIGNIDIGAILKGIPGIGSNGSNPSLNWLLPLLAGVAGGLDNRAQKTTSASTIDPALNPLRTSTINGYLDSLKDPNLTSYEASGVGDINKSADSQRRLAEETLAARGVSGPAAATAINNVDANRYSDVLKFRQSVPLLATNLRNQALQNASGFINSSPRNTEVNTSGNVLGGALGGTTELLAYLYGLGKI